MGVFNMLPQLIVVDRQEFELDLYKWRARKRQYVRVRSYPVAVGKIGHETPHGMYFVEAKSRMPDWMVPEDADYDPSTWGKIYKFGEEGNPFAGGFISLAGRVSGIGLHGTSFDPRVGTAASHGCIRLAVEDLLALYDHCHIGMPVYLH